LGVKLGAVSVYVVSVVDFNVGAFGLGVNFLPSLGVAVFGKCSSRFDFGVREELAFPADRADNFLSCSSSQLQTESSAELWTLSNAEL